MVIRDFKIEPISEDEVLNCRWYPVLDDTIGGWAISNVDQSVVDLNPCEGRFELGSFLTETEAKHICFVHNAWFEGVVAFSYHPNLGSYWITYSGHASLTRQF